MFTVLTVSESEIKYPGQSIVFPLGQEMKGNFFIRPPIKIKVTGVIALSILFYFNNPVANKLSPTTESLVWHGLKSQKFLSICLFQFRGLNY